MITYGEIQHGGSRHIEFMFNNHIFGTVKRWNAGSLNVFGFMLFLSPDNATQPDAHTKFFQATRTYELPEISDLQ